MKSVAAVPAPINTDVIRVLEEILADAKNGLVSDIAVAYVKPSGIVGNNFSIGENKLAALLGSVQLMNTDLLQCTKSVGDA